MTLHPPAPPHGVPRPVPVGDPDRRRRYASASMTDRRRRILAEAQALIGEQGVDGFTIRALSARAGVATRTLYNAFGGKEDIIAAAIEQHFTSLLEELPPPGRGDDLRGQLDLLRAIARRILTLRAYATAMAAVYFSPTADRRFYEVLRWISMTGTVGWIERAEPAGFLVRMSEATRERLTTLITNVAYANVTDWAAGRIDDAEFVRRGPILYLLNIHAYVAPSRRAEVDALLAEATGD